jgi:hypothetical protein
MDEEHKFQFSLRDIFILMLSFAVLFAAFGRYPAVILGGSIILGTSAVLAIGAWSGKPGWLRAYLFLVSFQLALWFIVGLVLVVVWLWR